jgi:hypothetical protein
MIEDEYKKVKDTYIKHVQSYMKEAGNLFPHITIFAKHKDAEDDKPAVIHIPIPDEFMEDDETKDMFVNDILPQVFKSVKDDFIPYSIAWGSEAWVRSISKDESMPDNYKSIPIKKEVLFVSIETKDKQESIIYDIKRNGKQVNSDGSITDIIELTEAQESGMVNSSEGRFSGLFKMLEKA